MTPYQKFKAECESEILAMSEDSTLAKLTKDWLTAANRQKYSYHFEFLGRPIIQYPQDMVAIQELVWEIKPDLIIETGIAHGGSLIMSASMLALLDLCEAQEAGVALAPNSSRRKVVGVDIDIRTHNREAIEMHPMASRITMIQGSSTAPEIVDQVRKLAEGYERVLVCLDSNHTHEHVLAELQAYAPLTSLGSYCVVFDTVLEDLPSDMFPDRPWGRGDNPKTAVHEYLKHHPEFTVDQQIEQKLMVTVAPNGYLRRIAQ
jgi:cephalosporin hydroxylase